jgi:hypothetical protein
MVLAGSKPDGSEYTKVSTPPYCGFSAAVVVVAGAVGAVVAGAVRGAIGDVVVVDVGAQDARANSAATNEIKITHTDLLFNGYPSFF